MDKEILNYLDKVGQYLQGAGEKGFEVYVHGVFVQSLIISITTIIAIIVSLFVLKSGIKFDPLEKRKEKQKEVDRVYSDEYNATKFFYIALPITVMIISFVYLAISLIGVFAPDYMVIKEIINNIGGK